MAIYIDYGTNDFGLNIALRYGKKRMNLMGTISLDRGCLMRRMKGTYNSEGVPIRYGKGQPNSPHH